MSPLTSTSAGTPWLVGHTWASCPNCVSCWNASAGYGACMSRDFYEPAEAVAPSRYSRRRSVQKDVGLIPKRARCLGNQVADTPYQEGSALIVSSDCGAQASPHCGFTARAAARAATGAAAAIASNSRSPCEADTNHASKSDGGKETPASRKAWKNAG